jgi:predicted nucleic acid-binding protein
MARSTPCRKIWPPTSDLLWQLLVSLFDAVLASAACSVRWTDPESFDAAHMLFLQHRALRCSFTDCLSFVVMRQLKLTEALTKDSRFRDAGFTALPA